MRPFVRQRSPALARLCQLEVLGAEEERRLFRHLRQAREQAARPDRSHFCPTFTPKTNGPAARVTAIRNRIALCNLRLVVSVAKRFTSPQQPVEDLVSEASLLLLRCVERFDARRGTRFSTYATRALAHHFVRLRKRDRRRCLRSLSPAFLDRTPSGSGCCESVERLIHLEDRERLNEQLAVLSGRERTLLAGRFGLDQNAEPQTFRELAVSHGLSKEWARVTTAAALERLRSSLAGERRP
jgi:RNA polymerase sigma factor (sigma-70 family)